MVAAKICSGTTARAWVGSVLLLGGLACHPSKKEMAELSAKIDELAQRQEVLLEGSAPRRSVANEASGREAEAADELARLEQRVRAMDERLALLEAKSKPRPRPRPGRPDPEARYRVEVGTSHVRGPDDALITLVAWTDYQCPFSGRVQETYEALRRKYAAKLRLVHKHNPLPMHGRALSAALAAEAAGRQGKFWEMHDALFEHQRELSDEDIEKYARKLGLNIRRFRRDLQDPELRARIDDEQRQGVTLGARGTPSSFVNGRFLSGAQPVEAFDQLIEQELEHARRMLDEGVKQGELYPKVIEDALEKP